MKGSRTFHFRIEREICIFLLFHNININNCSINSPYKNYMTIRISIININNPFIYIKKLKLKVSRKNRLLLICLDIVKFNFVWHKTKREVREIGIGTLCCDFIISIQTPSFWLSLNTNTVDQCINISSTVQYLCAVPIHNMDNHGSP